MLCRTTVDKRLLNADISVTPSRVRLNAALGVNLHGVLDKQVVLRYPMQARAVLTVVLAASALIVVLAFIREPVMPRFVAASLNYWFFAAAAAAVPASIVLLAVRSKSTVARIIGVALGLLLAIPLVPMAAIAAMEASDVAAADDPSHRLLGEIRERSGGVFRLYQSDCGATCGRGLTLYREFEYMNVVKLVFPVWSKQRQGNDTLHVSPLGQVQVLDGEHVIYERPR